MNFTPLKKSWKTNALCIVWYFGLKKKCLFLKIKKNKIFVIYLAHTNHPNLKLASAYNGCCTGCLIFLPRHFRVLLWPQLQLFAFFSSQLFFASRAGKHQLRKIMCKQLKLWLWHEFIQQKLGHPVITWSFTKHTHKYTTLFYYIYW